MKKENTKEILGDIFGGLMESVNKENIESYENNLGELTKEDIGNGDAERFWFKVMYKMEGTIDGMLSKLISSNRDVQFIFKNYQQVEGCFSELFYDYEGMACSSDKGRTLTSKILKYYATGEWEEFDYTQEYTYHLPNNIFKEKEMAIDFFKAIENVMSGGHKRYLEFFVKYKDVLVKTPQ